MLREMKVENNVIEEGPCTCITHPRYRRTESMEEYLLRRAPGAGVGHWVHASASALQHQRFYKASHNSPATECLSLMCQEYSEDIKSHTVGSLMIPRASIRWV